MSPIKWFKIVNAPCDEMWIDHKFWFPMIWKQIPFKAHFHYLNDDTMLDNTIIILSHSVQKSKEICVNFVIKKEHQILQCNNIEESQYLTNHKQVGNGESIENVALKLVKILFLFVLFLNC